MFEGKVRVLVGGDVVGPGWANVGLQQRVLSPEGNKKGTLIV